MVVTRRQNTTPTPVVASRTNSSAATPRLKEVKHVESSPLKTTTKSQTASSPRSQNGNVTPARTSTVGPQTLTDIKFDDDAKRSPSVSKSPSAPNKSATSKSKQKSKSKKVSKTKKQRPPKGITIFDVLARLALLFFIIYTVTVCPDDVELRSPVCRALTKYRRNILEPYVYPPIRATLDHPSIAPHVQRIQPYGERVVKITMPVYYRGKHEWRTKVLPRLRWMQIRARPYIRQANRRLEKAFGPYVQKLSEIYSQKMAPYVSALEVNLKDKWNSAKPWAYPVWRLSHRLPYIIMRNIVEPLVQARRQYVDPHVTKIWDAAVEQSKVEKEAIKTAGRPTASSETLSSTTLSEDTPEHTPESVSTTLSSETASSTATDKIEVGSVHPPTPLQETEATIKTSVLEVSASVPVEIPIPIVDKGDAASAASVVENSLFPTKSSESPPSTNSIEDEFDSDLEAFISELMEEDEPSEAAPPAPDGGQEQANPDVYIYKDETPEERDARFKRIEEENKEKRAEIEGRHTKWEKDLQDLGNSKIQQVISSLGRLRWVALKEAQTPGESLRAQVDILNAEAEKTLKSLKSYGKKLLSENKDGGGVQMWEDVLNKADKKFGQKVDQAANAVREWWSAQAVKEIREIEAIAEEVRNLADAAQTDLGMDYAWLGDVTYLDWQRYHRLMDMSKQFSHMYLGLQNGTEEDAPPNPLETVIKDLEDEVDDMILGFEVNLSILKRSILDQFSIDAGTDEPMISDSTASDEPKVSILPIESDTKQERKAKLEELSQAILSPDPEEIKQAAKRVTEAAHSGVREEL